MFKIPKGIDPVIHGIDAREFPKYGTRSMQVKFLLQYAILAPSGHNTQPWKFLIRENVVEVFADTSRHLNVVDPRHRELIVSCGAAIGVFQHAARLFGCRAHVHLHTQVSQSTPLASIELLAGPPPDEQETELFKAIFERHTQRDNFYDKAPDPEDIAYCRVIADLYDTGFYTGTKTEDKRALANLIANGDRVQYSNPDFRRELANWLKSKKVGSSDGMSADSFGLPDILTPLGSLLVRTINLGNAVGQTHLKQINQESAVIGMLTSKNEDIQAWIKTGQALSHVLLYLTTKGLSVSFYNEPIEIKALRKELSKLVGKNESPQMLFRVGFGPAGKASSRRPLEECLIAN